MVVAVTIVRVVQAAIDQVINMVAVRDSRVAAIGAAAAGARHRRTVSRVGFTDFDGVLVVVALVRKMQVAIVQVANMIAVLDAQMTAICAVNMGMVGMGGVGHGESPFELRMFGMFENLPIQGLNMLISQRIKNVLALFARLNQAIMAQNSQVVADGGLAHLQRQA